MTRWIIYYSVSICIIFGLNFSLFYAISVLSDGLFAILIFYYLQYFMLAFSSVLQIIIIAVNFSGEKIRLKFMSAFTAVYAVAFLITYITVVRYLYQINDAYTILEGSSVEMLADYKTNPFIGLQLLFVIPVLLQVFIFTLLYRKSKKANLNLLHENT
ncbi:MAG: hypothetical protein V4677_02030 [Bacteroidota bacterium]